MGKRWVGIAVSGEKLTIVDASLPNAGPMAINSDHTWKLQKGDRACAYNVMYQQLADYLGQHEIDRVIVKASALSQGGMKKAHLKAAELRGVVLAAAASVTTVTALSKAHISKNFGNRKADEYLTDEAFWAKQISGGRLRAGSREAALLLIAARE